MRDRTALTGKRTWLRIAIIVAGLSILGLAAFTVFVDKHISEYRVPDWAMAPQYNWGDEVFGFGGDRSRPDFGDVVIYITTNSPGYQIGRVAGLPGDHIIVDGGRFYRNEAEVPFFGDHPPTYQLQVAGAGLLLGNTYLFDGNWPPATAWSAPDRIPDDCYLILANDPNANDSHRFGLVPGSLNGPCASREHPQARIVMRVINSWPTGITREAYLARLAPNR